MRITFERFPAYADAYSVIERDDGVVYAMAEFSRGGPKLPHDLRHFIVERELGISDGIWGSIAAGAVYTSMRHLSGRRSAYVTTKSTAVKKSQRDRIGRAELFANLVEAVAMLDQPSVPEIQRLTREKLACVPLSEPGQDPADLLNVPPPAVLAAAASALQVEASRWARLRVGEKLVYEWRRDGWRGSVLAAGGGDGTDKALDAIPRPRDPDDGPDPRRARRRGPR